MVSFLELFLKEKKWGAGCLASKLLRERETGKGREVGEGERNATVENYL